uniref:Non-ribosomal peptide synthetase n=1 Tax=uncultured bacterium AZ_379 TaxID=1630015 RepID=A0A0E3M0J7_9BACT|nr:non-ribosomal peptide synthetase [uncultured bacterium AZ_379]
MNDSGGGSGLSFAEELLWSADSDAAVTTPFLNCPSSLSTVFYLKGALNRSALEASLSEIVRRHSVLRSRFVGIGDIPTRFCDPAAPVPIGDVNLGASQRPPLECAHPVLAREVQQPFELARGPLVRALLVKLPGNEHAFAVTVHHIVFDAWSKRIFALELQELYQRYVRDGRCILPPLSMTYSDYVSCQRDQLSSERTRQQIDYWARQLADMPRLSLPSDTAPVNATSNRTGTCSFDVAGSDNARLRKMARECRVTTATLIFAILKTFLWRLIGSDDVAVGVPVSDRRRPEFEHLIGLFANVVVVRTQFRAASTFRDCVAAVRASFAEALLNQDVPYGYLVSLLGITQPVYRVFFNFVSDIDCSLTIPGLQAEPLTLVAPQRSTVDFGLDVRDRADALEFRCVYRADLFSSTRMQECARQFQTFVATVLERPDQSIRNHAIEYLPPAHTSAD